MIQSSHASLECVDWRLTGHYAVAGCAQGINVSPGTLFTFGVVVLLEGCETGCHETGQGACLTADRLACGTKIDEHRATIVTNKNIGGLYIPVNKSLCMNLFEPFQDWQQQAEQALLVKNPPGFDHRGEICSLFVFHYHIAGIVVFEEAVDPHDIRVPELCQCFGFVEKAFFAPVENFGVVF